MSYNRLYTYQPCALRSLLAALALTLAATNVSAQTALASLSSKDQTTGLKTALTQAAQAAVGRLGKTDGFLADPEVRIPLPGKLEKAQRTLKMLGLNKQTDELVTAMNRAAEAAVPEAKVLFISAIKQMSVAGARGVLSGVEDAAEQYFRDTMTDKLAERFLPIVGRETRKVELSERYNEVAGKLSQLGLVDTKDANLDSYVTNKALDGLFLVMAKEEAAIRKDPLGQSSSILKKVFGAIGR
mgnify:CR=1 FL=1